MMQSFIYKCWFQRHPLRWLLLPLSLLFLFISVIRRQLYKFGLLKTEHPGVPVLIVGNISVGGNGKTPVVLKAVEWLVDLGLQPGILSRGYGGQCQHFPHFVDIQDSAVAVGDEPKMMASRAYCPVVIDPIRIRGAKALTKRGCNVIVCDDGLQHYALQRDIEWVVMDDRQVGNGYLLPMGPLRELPKRLSNIDAVIHNGLHPYVTNSLQMSLRYVRFVNVLQPTLAVQVADFVDEYAEQSLHAIAGIGSPQRFFDSLKEIGFNKIHTQGFADHHQFTEQDIPAGLTLMTEKDAVKCQTVAHNECWYLEIDAIIDETLKHRLDETLQSLHTQYQ